MSTESPRPIHQQHISTPESGKEGLQDVVTSQTIVSEIQAIFDTRRINYQVDFKVDNNRTRYSRELNLPLGSDKIELCELKLDNPEERFATFTYRPGEYPEEQYDFWLSGVRNKVDHNTDFASTVGVDLKSFFAEYPQAQVQGPDDYDDVMNERGWGNCSNQTLLEVVRSADTEGEQSTAASKLREELHYDEMVAYNRQWFAEAMESELFQRERKIN